MSSFGIRAAALVLSLLALDSRAAIKVSPPPLAEHIVVSDAPYPWDKDVHTIARIGDTQLFLSQSRGGSLAAGLLLGPIGVAANAKAVANRSADLASGVSVTDQFDIQAKIRELIAAQAPNMLEAASPTVSLAGALLISLDADDKVRSSLIIRVTDTTQPNGWSKGYFYHFAQVGDAKAFQAGGAAELIKVLSETLDQAISLTTSVVLDDLHGQLTQVAPVTVTSDFTMPLGKAVIPFKGVRLADRDSIAVFRLDGKPAMVMFPTVDGIHLFQAGQYHEQPRAP